jgi:hypothetical protein
MSIGMPGGSACEGVCIAAGVTAVGVCVQRNENRVHRGVECVMAGGCGVSRGMSRTKVEGLIHEEVEV